MASENAFEHLIDLNNKAIAKKRIDTTDFEIVEFNDISCALMLDNKGNRIGINITKLHSCLNCVKSADDCACKWFNGKMNFFIGLDSQTNSKEDADSYHFTGKGGFTGQYVDFYKDLFIFSLGAMKHKFAAWKWFNGKEDWDIDEGDGYLYLIHLPSKGPNVFKYGKTIYMIARYRVYLRNEPEEFRKLGIIRLCEMKVKNTSDGEDELGKEFAKLKDCRVVEGNEHVFVPGKDYNEAASNAIRVFQTVKEKLKGTCFDNYGVKGSVFQLNKDK